LTLASVLEGVISQRLIPTVDNKRIAALEILVKTARIEQLVLENRDIEILDAIEEGKEIYGSQSFDQAILDLYQAGVISQDKALEYATSSSDLKLRMDGFVSGKLSDETKSANKSEDEEKEDKRFNDEEVYDLKMD